MRTIKTICSVVTMISLFMGGSALAQCRGNCLNGQSTIGSGINMISSLPYQEPDESELTGLNKMREEEKLARDVYLTLNDIWNSPVLSNIARSEQKHMDAVKTLFDKYSIIDPVTDETVGVFTDDAVSELYEEFILDGSVSIENALLAGATIEDLDISDLNLLIDATDNEDMRVVYQNLLKGSRNHLRAFTSILGQYGITYEPQFLSQDEFDLIVSSEREYGRYDQDGNSVSGRGGSFNGKGAMSNGNGTGSRQGFIDEDGDGICDLFQ